MFATRVGGGLCIHMCAGRPSAVTYRQAHVMDRQAKILTLTLILEQYVDKERGLAGEAPAAARIETFQHQNVTRMSTCDRITAKERATKT
jgi:hypothetical protein